VESFRIFLWTVEFVANLIKSFGSKPRAKIHQQIKNHPTQLFPNKLFSYKTKKKKIA
jgi:hypothetical protein